MESLNMIRMFVLCLCVLFVPAVSFAQEVDTTKEWAMVGQLDEFGDLTRYLKVHSADTVHSSDSTSSRSGYATMFHDKEQIKFTITRFQTTEDVSDGDWFMNTKVMVNGKPMYKKIKLGNSYKILSLSKSDTLTIAAHLKAGRDVKCSVIQMGEHTLGHNVKVTITSKGFASPRKK